MSEIPSPAEEVISPSMIPEVIVENYQRFLDLRKRRRVSFHAEITIPSLLFLGPPGIGKSVQVKKAAELLAEKLRRELIVYSDDVLDEVLARPDRYFIYVDIRLSEVEPSDLIGIPRTKVLNNGQRVTVFEPLGWAVALSRCPGLLFLDELTNVQRFDVEAIAYKILLDRCVGFTKLHEQVVIVAAGNDPRHSTLARRLSAPLINRVKVYVVRAPEPEEWVAWMHETYGEEFDERVAAYLLTFREILSVPSEETSRNFPTPRSWTVLALSIKGVSDLDVIRREAYATIGPEAGARFVAFCKQRPPTVEQIMRDPEAYFEELFESRKLEQVWLSLLILSRNLDKYIMGRSDALDKLARLVRALIRRREFLAALLRFLLQLKKYDVIGLMTEAVKSEDELRSKFIGVLDMLSVSMEIVGGER